MQSFTNSILPKEIICEIAKKSNLSTCNSLKRCCKYLNENVKYITGENFVIENPVIQIYHYECSGDKISHNIKQCDCYDSDFSDDSDIDECSDDSDCECQCNACTRGRLHSPYCHSSIECLQCGEIAKPPREYEAYRYSESLAYW